MKRIIPFLLALLLCLAPCLAEEQTEATEPQPIILSVNGTEVSVIWEDNPSVQELKEHLPQVIPMTRFGGLQQVGYLEQTVKGNDTQTDAEPGDVILFEDRWIMLFYGYHTGQYTRLGHIPVELTEEDETEIAEDTEKTPEELEEDLKKEKAKEFTEIEKETAKETEKLRASGLEETELQAKTEELKAREKEKKTETLVKMKKIAKMKELIGGSVEITLMAGNE